MTSETPAARARVRHLDHINLTVRDLERSLIFYRDLFGFEVEEQGTREDGVPWAIVRSAAAMLCLYELPDLPSGPAYPERPVQQGMSHFALRIENGHAFARLLTDRRVPLLFGGPIRWPHSTSYYLADPTGHHIEVVQWDEDRIAFPPRPARECSAGSGRPAPAGARAEAASPPSRS